MRSRRLAVNIAGAFLSRSASLFSTLVIVPVAVAGLGPHGYGLLAGVLSATIIFSFADFGLGLALVNTVSVSEAVMPPPAMRASISRVWSILVFIGGAVTLGGTAIILLWWGVGGAFGLALPQPDIWLVLLISSATGIPTGITLRVLFALQRNVEATIWQSAARLAAMLGVVASWLGDAGIDWYVFSLVGLPTAVNWVSTAYVFFVQRPDLRPQLRRYRLGEIWADLKLGLQFVILNLAIFVQTGIDNILIGLICGAVAVTHFDVVSKLFNYVPALCSIAVFPLWPALRHALSEGDIAWARKMKHLSYATTAVMAAFASAVLVIFYHTIIWHWTGLALSPMTVLALGWAAFNIFNCIGVTQSMVMNASNLVAYQSKWQLVIVPVLLVAKLAALVWLGPAAMVWVLAAITAVQFTVFERKLRSHTPLGNRCGPK